MAREKIKLLSAHHFKHGVARSEATVSSQLGNRHAAKENMSLESHQRRIQGLFKTWEIQARKHRGEKVPMPKRVRRILMKRERRKLRESVAKEAREIMEIARKHAESAMIRLAEIVQSPDSQDTAAIAAAQVLLDRAYGKANQTNINANVDANGKPAEVTGKELDSRIASALKRVEDLTSGAPEEGKSEERPPDVCERDRDPGGSTVH